MKITSAPNPPTPKPKTSAASLLGLGDNKCNVDVFLGGKEYQNIDEKTAAQMLGHFTQTMKAKGFPWRMQEPTQTGVQGRLTGSKSLSDLQALRRLQQNQPVLFQPMRNLQVDLSADSLTAIAAAGTLGAGVEMASVANLANLTSRTRVNAGSQGFEVRHGEPIEVRSLAELKLLYQMYKEEEKLTTKDTVGRAAQQLAFFNQQTSDYGWRYYQKDDSHLVGRVAKAGYRGAVRNGLMGGATGAVVGVPLGLVMRSLPAFATCALVGAAAFGLYGAIDGMRTAAKGKPVNTVEALDSVLEGKPVEFQETHMRGFGVPVFGKVSWVSDRGPSSTVSNPADLETFFWMQNRAAKEDPPPPPEKPKSNLLIPQPHVVLVPGGQGEKMLVYESGEPIAPGQRPRP